MKLKGQTVRTGKKQYVLKDMLGQGGFSMIYETNIPDIICKVQVLANNEIAKAYMRQKQMLQQLTHPNIVKLYDTCEIGTKDEKYGLLFMEKCSSGTAFNILQKNQGKNMNQKTIIKILSVVTGVLEYMHRKGIAHRDIKMENILLNSQGQFKLCDFGSCSKTTITQIDASNRVQIEQLIEKTTTPLYRSPQQLDLYSGFEIGVKVDIFALGVLAFILCFQKPPFQSRLSAINKQYFQPQDHSYSKQLLALMEKCFTTNPRQRPSAAEVRQQLKNLQKMKRVQLDINCKRELQVTLAEISRVNQNNLKKNVTVAESGFLDKIKRLYNQITTETEGWIAGFVEDNQQAPLLKYNRSIISKCYEKKYKIQKVYDLIYRYSQEYKGKSLVTLKILILLHNFLRKGPSEAITYSKQNSPLNFCTKIYKLWKSNMKTVDEQDFKRNPFLCLLIRLYALILIKKIKLCYENSNLIEANYSIVPYLSNIKENTILKLNFINDMIGFLHQCLDFHQNVQRVNYITDIQKTIVLSMIDQEYCLISTLTFLLSTFKIAVCHVKEQIDLKALHEKVTESQYEFEKVYRRLAHLIDKSQKTMMLENSNMALKLQVISYIKGIKLQKKTGPFNVTDHLNYKNTIYGLKIPLTYQEVVKNPDFLKELEKLQADSKLVVEVNQFKNKKQSPQSNKSLPVQTKKQIKTQTSQSTVSQKQATNPTAKETSTAFTKVKQSKGSVFQNFNFNQQKKHHQPKQPELKKSTQMMEFTHQNLNKDFFSVNQGIVEEKHDQFRDFFSIVQNKFQKEKQTKKISQLPEQPYVNSNASKEVFQSESKADINKIELMNFFFDDDEREKDKNTNSPKKLSPQKPNNLIQLEEDQLQIPLQTLKTEALPHPNKPQKEDLMVMIEQKQQKNLSQRKVKSNKSIELGPTELQKQKSKKQSSKDDNLIDLREFVVEEVRRNAEQYVIEFSCLIFKEKIGYGNSSQVFKGEWRGREVAIKKIKQSVNSSRSEKEFKRQIITSVKIRHHPQLVPLIGVSQHQNYFYIINQYCNGSTLFDLLHESNQKIPWSTRISIARQIARGMVFLHTNDPPIIHRDLKSLNVLLFHKYDPNNPDMVQIKIADFGLSRDYASTYMTGTLGTYHWMAPQIFNNQPYTLKADVYSYGIVLWQIASRVPPYTNMKNPHSLMKFVTMQNGRPDMNLVDRDCPLQLRMLMMRCWDKFPSNRPNFNQILNCLQYLG